MLLSNHTLTGIAIGLSLDNPAVILPVAVASHFYLDAIPHFGNPKLNFLQPVGRIYATIDCAIALSLAVASVVIWPERFVQLTTAVFGATLPDLLYIPRYLLKLKFWEPLFRFHSVIQTERLWGAATEITWASLMLIVIRAYH